MTAQSHKKLVAWLGLAAMWLAICVPAVSQYLAARHASESAGIYATYCTVAPSDGTHATDRRIAPTPVSDHGQACGYCTLLANHPPLAQAPLMAVPSFTWVARAGPAASLPLPALRPDLTPPARAPPRHFS